MVKLFLKKPSNNQGLVQKVLQQATADNDNPDIRDRAYVYWRLLSGDLEVAKVRLLRNIAPRWTPAVLTLSSRASFYPKNLPSLLPYLAFLQHSWNSCSVSFPLLPPSTTSRQSPSWARAASGRTRSNVPPFKNSAKTQRRTLSPPPSPLRLPMARRHSPRATSKTSSISTSTVPRRPHTNNPEVSRRHLTGSLALPWARPVQVGHQVAWQI